MVERVAACPRDLVGLSRIVDRGRDVPSRKADLGPKGQTERRQGVRDVWVQGEELLDVLQGCVPPSEPVVSPRSVGERPSG